MDKIDKLIINSPYDVPSHYWHYDRETRTFDKRDGRRPAGYVVATPQAQGFDDPGKFIEIDLVNRIRLRGDIWRAAGYPGVTGITKRLLDHWKGRVGADDKRFFSASLKRSNRLFG